MPPHDPTDLRFQTLLETAPIAIVVVNATGQIELVNKATETLFGYERGELLGQALEVLLPSRLTKVHHIHRANYFTDPRVRPMGVGLDLVGLKQDGSEFPLEIALSYITTQEGIKAIAFVTDISARRHAEATQAQLHAELAHYAADLEERVQTRTHEIERRRAVAESLRDILAVLNANTPLSTTLALIVAQASKVLAVPATLLVERTATATLEVVATSGLPPESSTAWQSYVGVDSVTSAIERGLPLAVADFTNHAPQGVPLPLEGGGASRSLLAVPLEVEGTVYGALVLYHRTPHHFSEEEI
jgi:PAS domain S-box-containing protein